MNPTPHLFYTQLGPVGQPALGTKVVPLDLILSVTIPSHAAGSYFEVIGNGFIWPCWAASVEATEAMHRDLMERWGALHKPATVPTEKSKEVMEERNYYKSLRDILAKDRDQIVNERNLFKVECDKALEQVRQLEIERDHITGVDSSDSKVKLTLTGELYQAKGEIAELKAERDKALEQVRQLEIERDYITGVDASDHKAEIIKFKAENSDLRALMEKCIADGLPVMKTIAERTVTPMCFLQAEVWCDKWGRPGIFPAGPPSTERGKWRELRLSELKADTYAFRKDVDEAVAACDKAALCMIISNILGCEPAQFTDRRNPDHLRVVVDLLPIMRMDRSEHGWGEVADEIDKVTAQKQEAKP